MKKVLKVIGGLAALVALSSCMHGHNSGSVMSKSGMTMEQCMMMNGKMHREMMMSGMMRSPSMNHGCMMMHGSDMGMKGKKGGKMMNMMNDMNMNQQQQQQNQQQQQ